MTLLSPQPNSILFLFRIQEENRCEENKINTSAGSSAQVEKPPLPCELTSKLLELQLLGPSSVALCKSVGLRPATTGKGSAQLTQWPEPPALPILYHLSHRCSIPHAKAAGGTARFGELTRFNPTVNCGSFWAQPPLAKAEPRNQRGRLPHQDIQLWLLFGGS